MTREEIMIGDWVYDKHFNGDIEPIQIHNIYGNDVNCKTERNRFDVEEIVSGTYIKNLMPIPLTPEILEKNGFVKQDYDGWLIREDNGRGLIEYRTDYFDGFLIINYIKKPFSKISIKLKHVHELQHALRLCGIDKEIEI